MSTIVLSQQNFSDPNVVPIPNPSEFIIGFDLDGILKIKYDDGSIIPLVGNSGPIGATGPVGPVGLSVGGGNSLVWQAGNSVVTGQFDYPNGNWGIINNSYNINVNQYEFFANSDVTNWFSALLTGLTFAGPGKAVFSIYQTDDNTNFAIFTLNSVTNNTSFWTLNGQLLIYGNNPSIVSGSTYNLSWLLFGKDGVGSSGVSGSSGISGSSGTSGNDGSSGTSGISGSTGLSGSSGTSGTDGSSGTSGISGSSGTSGFGSSGTSGESGSSGTSGEAGSSGSSGTSGVDVISNWSYTQPINNDISDVSIWTDALAVTTSEGGSGVISYQLNVSSNGPASHTMSYKLTNGATDYSYGTIMMPSVAGNITQISGTWYDSFSPGSKIALEIQSGSNKNVYSGSNIVVVKLKS